MKANAVDGLPTAPQTMKILQLLCGTLLFTSVPVLAQSSKQSYRATCTMKLETQLATLFHCRWMRDGTTGSTIFVDNGDTNERYTVTNASDASGWSAEKGRECIKMAGGTTKVCSGDQRQRLNGT
jgi:hypothetical protein